ncbi:helix-turn-helix domain-containing protein [Rhodopirellula sp. SWK7]|uniref:helix-turn-helix domain-containing protein n=1 Tax=Rhodopirellula sp. SWK7 TaxID=595460 RepID=UPI0002BD7E9D|nr:helix-turn-helix transcriptional regulator [Rhodopirellula sp. SWK7]EMI44892.1 Helix-turn-helix type 3 domain protein [Rhodopirellula sp. SWK7]
MRVEKNLYTDRQKVLLALLRECRERANLRQADVAERLEKPQSFVSKYESGERRLEVLELLDVCEAMDITLVNFVRRLEKRLAGSKPGTNDS